PLFPRQQEVELGWRILDPVEDFWASYTKPEQYPAGSAGPASAEAMMARNGRAWRRL
ncbi:MAG TPA: glucose-6-phosphate dehydrogenase, partial [Streptosporangiaceae bacterium]|nr:glucose-6-phosphate dehydrogenase [Streptosporangiaceae bacterium]